MIVSEKRALDSWRSFVRAKAEIGHTVFCQLRDRGLTGAQLGILRVLSESADDGLRLNEISQRLYVTSGNVTGLVDRLEEGGYLQRTRCPEDRRAIHARLTPAGRKLFQSIYPSHIERVKHLMSVLSKDEQVVLADLLSRLTARAVQMRETK